ncbi:hypothetical protein ABZ671_01235 [Micromonospora sp. NPDC006766]|uniref:hypothetical protein n=1 Tax=Micromonospora sp. NPDC006766 TaxID=3154778 RepID=UPI0033F07483
MTVRSLPEPCWLLLVEDGDDGPEEQHSVGGEGSQFFAAIADLWVLAGRLEEEPPLPYRADRPCLVLWCSLCEVPFGSGEGEHFETAEEAVAEAAMEGWVGQLCPGCAGHAGPGFGDSLDGPPDSR